MGLRECLEREPRIMGDEEPTREELMEICKRFMLNAPPGEFMEVVTDIRGLVQDESVINDVVPGAFSGYNKVIICNEGCVNGAEYLDPVSHEVVSFDHITRKVTGTSDGSQHFSGTYEEIRAAFQKECEAYVADHYANGTGAVYNSDDGVIIAISAAKYEPRNFWTGSWRAVWRVSFAAGTNKGADIKVNGQLDLSVHFYEDGNVQLRAGNALEAKVKAGAGAGATASAVFKAIGVAEAKYQQSLEAAYATMDTPPFKALRRQLPVTATKIDWDKIGHAKIGDNASGKK